jgi:DNA uptake protein ComE-like DNA-binding protein
MKLPQTNLPDKRRSQKASVLIIVLWICIGLVSISLYFANSMTFELRASANRSASIATEQAIEGAARYVGQVLATYATNGAIPVNTQFSCENVAIGESHFWLIGRDPSGTVTTKPFFGVIDEGSKLNLNTATTNALAYLPNMTIDIANTIVDWRDTNGTMSLGYATMGYEAKHAVFETVDELRLVDGVTLSLLNGSDVNHNGIVDTSEKNSASGTDAGILDYLTIYSREPNFKSDGTALTNANTPRAMYSLLENHFGSSRARQITNALAGATLVNPLDFYFRANNTGNSFSADDFAQIYDDLSFSTNGMYILGRVNVNTASANVLYALFIGIGVDDNTATTTAQTLVDYRTQNPDQISTLGWVVDCLGRGNGNTALAALRRGDYITTRSYQFTADIAATGPLGRGFQRVKFVFDTSDGTPRIIYRQDLSRLGWALGDEVRETLLAKDTQ